MRLTFQTAMVIKVANGKLSSIKVKLNHGRNLLKLQEAYLSVASLQSNVLNTADEAMAEIAQEGYEVARILNHRRGNDGMGFLVQWEGFDISEVAWATLQHPNYKQCIQGYWRAKISF
ncbi:hypothetical protein BX616_004072 [Lobosporangium transversale]|uniref:Chromo domain-containing protein n=1 Tax=Lobosporangium transversale TaxID=64571 RepID=A0A1Y2GCF8_9FUNG|nr:hypothetical protein BCR41DRAFT_360461 [Lobosporangium transversale]KAF9898409.1 hypothetical protein BX616_004072 [Lobosporangium transversale]ORZ06993.1 hypothetical protein BCR41DRAFT_360461 [Lobosporangium transversale]|eukprot:XP_021877789.1 hypothetical protein BCR41DRAFT_360461 [Lobosporangium transversale]